MINFKDYQKKSSILIPHYHSILGQADNVYLASDSATCGAGGILRDTAAGSDVMKDTPVIMVKPGFEALCRNCKCDSIDNMGRQVDYIPGTNGIPVVDRWIRQQMFHLFCEMQKSSIRSLSSRGLHIMLSPDSEWSANGKLCVQQDSIWTDITEQKALQLTVYRKHRDCSQIVISQDFQFLQSLRELCKTGIKGSANPDGLITLSLNDQGYLYDPFDAVEGEEKLLARMSRNKLANLVREIRVYTDDSALRHPQAYDMLQNIKPGLVQAEQQLVVLASKQEPLTHADILVARAQETPATVRFVWLRDALNKTEALADALLTDTASLPQNSRIALITDRVPRAEKIQQQLSGTGVHVEIYSINKHGFLSNRDKAQAPHQAGKPSANTSAKNKQLIEQAVKSGHVQEALALAADKEALKSGIITCLCEKQADILEQLLRQADRIQSTIINWWILEYKQFLSPSFLMENPRFYYLFILALSKCNFFAPQAEKWVERLMDLEESPAAAKVELSFIISLLRLARDRAGVTGATRIRRSDIPKELPKSDRSEADFLRCKIQELRHRQEQMTREIAKLQAEQAEITRQITIHEAELSAMRSN